jgi:hypothetical protein
VSWFSPLKISCVIRLATMCASCELTGGGRRFVLTALKSDNYCPRNLFQHLRTDSRVARRKTFYTPSASWVGPQALIFATKVGIALKVATPVEAIRKMSPTCLKSHFIISRFQGMQCNIGACCRPTVRDIISRALGGQRTHNGSCHWGMEPSVSFVDIEGNIGVGAGLK